jgi:8-oxo-dGTP pyrophosphatase MutT (NUDIX family)
LPGGRWEITDKSLYHTALRESREEIGIVPERVHFCGKLTDLYIPPSNYIVSPFAGIYTGETDFEPNAIEVQDILEIPLCQLLDEKLKKIITIDIGNEMTIETPCFDLNGIIIWGATAMMMNEMLILWKTTV